MGDKQQSNEFDLAMATFELMDKKNRDYSKTVEMYEQIAENIKLLRKDVDMLVEKFIEFEKIAIAVKYDIKAVVKILQDLSTI